MKTNRKSKVVARVAPRTAGGAVASSVSKVKALERSVLACMLWEGSFYESGEDISKRIGALVKDVPAAKVSEIAVRARNEQKLRHVPLLLAREMARIPSHNEYVADTLDAVIQRADELSEFVSLYWKDGKQPLTNQVKKGLARAFPRFDEYQLAKYAKGEVSLRDVLRLVHPKPKNRAQAELWGRLAKKTLATPETWEVTLSGAKESGQTKKEAWESMLAQKGKLGAMALIKNLRNMIEAGVSDEKIRRALLTCNAERVLPFRFITAAKYAPKFEPELEQLMFRCLENREKLSGKTVLIVDVSGSMTARLSAKSENSRLDTAAALAMLVRELSEEIVVYATAGSDMSRVHKTSLIPARRGFALKEQINEALNRLGHGGIFLKQVMDYVSERESNVSRVICISDSQDCDVINKPDSAKAFGKNNYLLDISCEKNGIAYNKFTVINGFSEAALDYIQAFEKLS